MNTDLMSARLETSAPTAPQRSETLRDWVEISVVVAFSALAVIAGQLLEPNSFAERLTDYVWIFGTLGAVYLFQRRRGAGFAELGLCRPAGGWKALLFALPTFLLVMLLAGVVQTFVVAPLTQGQGADIGRFALLRGNLPRLLGTLAIIWVTAAFAEEVIYRGFLMSRLARRFGGGRLAWLASLLLSSAVFSMLHLYQGPAGVAITGFVGLLIGIVYLASGRNLWIGILVHGLVDTASLTAVYFGATT
jgi:membrane protease YdiL (CAAX protease family)